METVTLILLPGMDGSGLLFAPFVRALPAWVHPVVVAYPADRPLDYAGHLEIVRASLPAAGPFVLLGESFSGPLALMAAAVKPKGLCGVVLCASFICSPLPSFISPLSILVMSQTVDFIPWSLRRRIVLGRHGSDAGR